MTLPALLSAPSLPVLVSAAGERAGMRFLEFFAANIRNPHTRRAYTRAADEFLAWCARRHQMEGPGTASNAAPALAILRALTLRQDGSRPRSQKQDLSGSRKSGSQWTRRWREDGFEPSVPLVSRGAIRNGLPKLWGATGGVLGRRATSSQLHLGV